MPSSAEVSDEKLAAAIKAVHHVLLRICQDAQLAHLMGHGTECYELLCQAVATYKGQTVAEIMEVFAPAKPAAPKPGMKEGVSAYMTPLQRYVTRIVGVAPVIATEIIRYAERRGLELFSCGDDADENLADHCAETALNAFGAWADSKRRAA